MLLLADHIAGIAKLCSSHRVKHLYAFGSVLTDKFTSDSDIDFLVAFLPIDATDYADNYFELKYSLEAALKHKVDLIEENALKNPYFISAIDRKKQLVYGS